VTLIRSLVFQLFFSVWTLFLAIAFLPLMILPRGCMVRASLFWSLSLFAALRLICGLKHRIEGRGNIPDGPALFAVKHQSAWDTLMMPVVLPGAAVVLKKELTWLPFYGWYIRKYGTIGIDRGRGVSALRNMRRAARDCAEAGRSIIVFPEGTRVAPGETGAFHPGIAALYGDLNLPVVPVALNSGRFWRRRGFLRHPGTITLKFLPVIKPGLERRDFMKRLERDISSAQGALDPPG